MQFSCSKLWVLNYTLVVSHSSEFTFPAGLYLTFQVQISGQDGVERGYREFIRDVTCLSDFRDSDYTCCVLDPPLVALGRKGTV